MNSKPLRNSAAFIINKRPTIAPRTDIVQHILTNTTLALAVAAVISILLLFSISMSVGSTNLAHAAKYKGVNREFWLTNMDNTKINETKTGLPQDMFTTTSLVVKKGDNVTIHFYNVEDQTTDRHSFSIDGKPYAMSVILNGGENKTISFLANQTGIWTYYCIFHEPLMKGQLIVEAPTLDELDAQG